MILRDATVSGLRKCHECRKKSLSVCAVADLTMIVESPTVHGPARAHAAGVSPVKRRTCGDGGERDAPGDPRGNQSVGRRSITQLTVGIETPTVRVAAGRDTARVTIVAAAN